MATEVDLLHNMILLDWRKTVHKPEKFCWCLTDSLEFLTSDCRHFDFTMSLNGLFALCAALFLVVMLFDSTKGGSKYFWPFLSSYVVKFCADHSELTQETYFFEFKILISLLVVRVKREQFPTIHTGLTGGCHRWGKICSCDNPSLDAVDTEFPGFCGAKAKFCRPLWCTWRNELQTRMRFREHSLYPCSSFLYNFICCIER